MNKTQIAQCVELVCQNGCREVRTTITRLESEQTVSQVDGLNAAERRQVLEELKAIMAVYDRT